MADDNPQKQPKALYKKTGRTFNGQYVPKHPEKYLGHADNITFRSGWELKCMKNFDLNSRYIRWSSEEIMIPYISPKDGKHHRYYPDFFIVEKGKDNELICTLIEVKPYKETIPPTSKGKKKSRFLQEAITYEVNSKKWEAARKYCEKRNWNFIIMTEKEIL